MDFLDIRKKAKERARARAEAQEEAKERGTGAPATGEEHAEPRFTTWRPGTGAPPALPVQAPAGVVPDPHDEDFAVVAPDAARGAPPERRGTDIDPARAELDPLDDFFYHPDEAGPALPQLAAAAAPEEAAPASLVREEYLTVLLGAEEYAIAIGRVREVLRAPPITEVPRAPPHVLGVVTVRGEVVAVIDPRRRLGLPPRAVPEGEGKVVIVDAGEGPCGLLVDRVASVVRLLPGSVEPCPQGIAGPRAEFLAGIGRAGERLFTVLELGAVLRRARPEAEGSAGPRRADAGA